MYSHQIAYSKEERVFHLINRCISLKDEDIKKNNEILNQVLEQIITFLQDRDPFFKDCYKNIVFAGSYYKGTKVGTPNEFDLNLVIGLPVKCRSIQFEQDIPGYTKLKLCDSDFHPMWNKHRKLLLKWMTGNCYLRNDKFRQWMESLFSHLPQYSREGYTLKVRKSGPAFTLTVSGLDLSCQIDVDLVPVLEFDNAESLNRKGINGKWHAVPKPLEPNTTLHDVQWRISFYTLEKSIFKRYENGFMKPVIRQIKKLRDKYQLNFASYYIETLFLAETRDVGPLRRMGNLQLFLHMLVLVKEACRTGMLPNFWDPYHNLIAHLPEAQLTNMAGQLTRIINKIIVDNTSVASYILTPEEYKLIEEQLHCIVTGNEYVPILDKPLKAKEDSSWCTTL